MPRGDIVVGAHNTLTLERQAIKEANAICSVGRERARARVKEKNWRETCKRIELESILCAA